MISRKKTFKNLLLFCCISFLFSITSVSAVDVDDLQIIPKYVLDTNGYNADVAVNPVDNSVHASWVKAGDLYYAYRRSNGSWSSAEKIPDGGITLFGIEDQYDDGSTVQGTCAAMTVTENGEVCFAYTEEAGNVYFVKGTSGDWSTPVKISGSSSVKTNLDMIEANGSIYVTYEEGAADYQYMCSFINGSWGTPKNLGRGEATYLTKNKTGTIYFLGRSREAVRNARFGYFQAGENTVNFVTGATDAVVRMGHGPNLAVGNGNLYLAWSDVLEQDNTHKTALYCATAAEPGLSWNTKLGGNEPLYWENTGAPFSYVEVFKDGTVLYLNGRRASRRFMIWDGKNWSKTRQAPWESGIPNVASDGTTIWVAVSELPGTEVSVTGISLPGAEDLGPFDILNKNVFDTGGFSGDIALDPVNGALHAAWVHNGDIRFRVKNTDGDWGDAETIPDNNIKVYGEDQYGYPQQCMSLDVDASGLTHIVFTDDNGDVYYIKGNSGSWETPVLIENSGPLTLYPDIITSGEYVAIVYQDVTNNGIRTAEYKNGAWQPAGLLEQGTFPSLYRGENGMIYILYQEHGGKRNARFAWKVPGFTGWNFSSNVTDADDEVGDSPALSVGNGRIYLAWNNNTETSGDYKSQIYCAAADEPGLTWTGKLGLAEPIYYENTSAPLLRTAVYSDGKVILLNGRRRSPRFTIWDGSAWSLAYGAPWDEGRPQIVCDGRTTWAVVSDISTESGQVSVSGVRNLDAQKIDFTNESPAIISFPDTNAVANSLWSYQCLADDDGVNPLSFSLVLFPEGMTINSATGKIEWTPDQGQMEEDNWGKGKGVFLVGVKADDEKGGYAAQYFWLYIRGSNHAPQITSMPVTEAFVDSLYSYQVTAEDEDGDALKYYINQGPVGMSIDSLSGLISWMPVNGQAGDHEIVVSVNDGKTGTDSQNFTVTVTKIYTAPEALFSADTTSGLVPLSVQFTDLSTGDITEWAWDFGDSTTSTLQNPGHTYTHTGSYTVKLTVSGPAGNSALSRENYITVLPPAPVAGFSADPLAGIVPLTVKFTDASFGDIISWFWDFGDSTTSNEQNPEHVYHVAGTYTVSLAVTGDGGSDTLKIEDYIKADNPTGIESTELLPTDYNLNQNYPNPFNSQTTIEYQLPKYTNVSVSIYDINGKLINILHDGRQEAGSYKLNWDGTDYSGSPSASGLYIIQMRAGTFSDDKKVILIK